MVTKLLELVGKYQRKRNGGDYLFRTVSRTASGEWKDAVDRIQWGQGVSIQEIYRRLQRLAKEEHFKGVGREKIQQTALDVANQLRISDNEAFVWVGRMKYIQCLRASQVMNNITLSGWDLIDFLVMKKYSIIKLLKESDSE